MQACEDCGMTIYTNNPKRTLCRECEQDHEERIAGENKYNLNGGI